MNLDQKSFLAEFKFCFATIFARTMTNVIVGANLTDNRVFYFSNLEPVDVEFYSPDPSQFIHQVRFMNEAFIADLYTQFPVLKESIAWLKMDTFMAGVNQHAGTLAELKLELNKDKLVLHYKAELPHPRNAPPIYEFHQVICGKLISMYQLDRYSEVLKFGYVDPATAVHQSLVGRLSTKDSTVVLDLGQPFPDYPRQLKCLIHINKSTISVNEVVNRTKLTNYTHEILLARQKNVVQVNIRFCSEKFEVISTQPFLLWYFTPSTNNPKPHEDTTHE